MRSSAAFVIASALLSASGAGEAAGQDVSPAWALAAATGRIPAAELRRALAETGFPCTGAFCTQLKSCAQAFVELHVCGRIDRDRDGDGMPCEGTRCPVMTGGRLLIQGGGTP